MSLFVKSSSLHLLFCFVENLYYVCFVCVCVFVHSPHRLFVVTAWCLILEGMRDRQSQRQTVGERRTQKLLIHPRARCSTGRATNKKDFRLLQPAGWKARAGTTLLRRKSIVFMKIQNRHIHITWCYTLQHYTIFKAVSSGEYKFILYWIEVSLVVINLFSNCTLVLQFSWALHGFTAASFSSSSFMACTFTALVQYHCSQQLSLQHQQAAVFREEALQSLIPAPYLSTVTQTQ